MGLFAAIFGTGQQAKAGKQPRASAPPASANQSSFQSSSASGFASSSMLTHAPGDARQQFTVRRDLLRLVLRDTLTRTGIPTSWVEIQALAATSGGKSTGVHARFVVKHWSPLVMVHTPGLEHAFVQRLMALDPLADHWMMGFSWQLALAEDVEVAPLPRPGAWTAQAHAHHAQAAPAAASASADVIAGPVRIGANTSSTRDAKADLERLMAAGDADRRSAGTFDSTQPAPLR
jgi:hypothetical protein